MAVFPDKIVLKHSTDSQIAIESAIGSGGTDEIVAGELVVGREAGAAKLYTLDSAGEVVRIAGGGGSVPLFVDGYLNANSTSDTSHTLNAPTHEEGDLLIAIIMWRVNGLPITEPADWTLYGTYLAAVNASGTSQDLYVYTKTATASEPASYTWTGGGSSTPNCGAIVSVAYGGIASVDEYVKTVTGTGGVSTTCSERYLSIIAHTWVNTAASTETAYMIGGDVQTLDFSSVTQRRLQVGYTNSAGSVVCYHSSSDTSTNQAGAIVINVKLLTGATDGAAYDLAMDGGDFDTGLTDDTTTIFDQFPISIDAHSDVDTTTDPPVIGEALLWDGTNWVPGTASTVASLDDLTDVTITAAATGEVLRYNGSQWVDVALSINDLSDVDTATTPPSVDQVLVWNGSNWIPGDQTSGGGGAVQTAFITESQTAASGAATFVGIGQSGQLVQVTSDLDAWIVLYPTAAARTADSGRAFGVDPSPGSGVLAEFFVPSATTVLATPGTTYFNNDSTKANAIYAAVRDTGGSNVNAEVTLECYAADNVIGYRTALTATTASLADGAAGNITFTETGKAGMFVSIETDRAAWVTIYTSTAARTADSGRAETTDPSPGSGVLAEVITTGAEVVKITPVAGYFNDEGTPLSELYAKVVNKSGALSTVQINITIVPSQP